MLASFGALLGHRRPPWGRQSELGVRVYPGAAGELEALTFLYSPVLSFSPFLFVLCGPL